MANGKDPAFLWYANDWTGGTSSFTRHQKGCYMDLLMTQFNMFDEGHLSIDDIKNVLGVDFEQWEKKLKVKFKQDAAGKFFNETLEQRILDRRRYTASRRNNLGKEPIQEQKPISHMKEHMNPHMSSHMEIVNENVIKDDTGNKKKKIEKPKKSAKKAEVKKSPKTVPKNITEDALNFYNLTSALFKERWNNLLQTKKWRKKINHSLQITLDKLKIYPVEFACELILDATEREWQGVVFENTPERFRSWQKNNSNKIVASEANEFNKDFRGN